MLLSTSSRAPGFSSCGSQFLEHRLSSCGSRALEHSLNSCGMWASLLPGMWDLLGSGIKPVSAALASAFFTTELPGKPSRPPDHGPQHHVTISLKVPDHHSGCHMNRLATHTAFPVPWTRSFRSNQRVLRILVSCW